MYAAGSGRRFGGFKQFERIDGVRLVDRCIDALRPLCDGIVVVLPDGVPWDGPAVERAVVGGATNPESVRAGVAAVPPSAGVIVCHSPSHPLASTALMRRTIAKVIDEGFDGAAPGAPIHDTLKQVAGDVVVASVPKHGVLLCQMPLVLRAATLRTALEADVEGTDVLSIAERAGARIGLVPGDALNLHVTTPLELAMARRLAALVESD